MASLLEVGPWWDLVQSRIALYRGGSKRFASAEMPQRPRVCAAQNRRRPHPGTTTASAAHFLKTVAVSAPPPRTPSRSNGRKSPHRRALIFNFGRGACPKISGVTDTDPLNHRCAHDVARYSGQRGPTSSLLTPLTYWKLS